MSKKPAPIPQPRLPGHDTPDDWPEGYLEAKETYRGLNLVGAPFEHAEVVTLASCRIQQADLGHVGLGRVELEDVLVYDCNLSSTDWSQGSTKRVIVSDCRTTGLKLNGMRVWQTVFRACQGKYTQAAGTVFKEVRFEGCQLQDANFDDADLRGVVFDDCDLQDATFARAKLDGADFRTSRLEASRVGIDVLKGALITPSQAVALFVRTSGAIVDD